MNGSEQGIAMIIGGADGLPEDLVARADFTWSASGRPDVASTASPVLLTFEQLYRALSILRGEPVHRP